MTKHPYIIINVVGLLIALACFFSEILTFGLLILIYFVIFEFWFIGLPVLIVLNLISAVVVENNKKVLAIIVSLPFASFGGLIAAHTTNKNYAYTKSLKLILNAHMWIIVWYLVSQILWSFGYYKW